jgi:hypothetical protein
VVALCDRIRLRPRSRGARILAAASQHAGLRPWARRQLPSLDSKRIVFPFLFLPGRTTPSVHASTEDFWKCQAAPVDFFDSRRGNERVQKPHPLLTQRMEHPKTECQSWAARRSLFLWFFGWGCWMPDGVLPTAARETYCLVMLPLQLEGEPLLAQSSEIQI